jgi:hypothetical protein
MQGAGANYERQVPIGEANLTSDEDQEHELRDELPPGFHIARRHSYITVSWE